MKATIKLPSVEVGSGYYLHPDLRFGDRVPPVAGSALRPFWGGEGDRGRSESEHFVGRTWKEAFDKAEAWARNELKPLLDALAARKAALEAAED